MPPEGCEHPLHRAAMLGDAAEVARLLATGEDPNATDAQGATALHMAAALGHSCAIRTLLAGGATPTFPDLEGDLPLHSATLGSQLGAVRLLLDAAPHTPASVNQRGQSPLLLAVLENNTATVRLLLKAAPEAACFKRQRDGLTPLHLAAEYGREEMVDVLLDAAPQAALEREHAGATPLLWACTAGHPGVVRRLLAAAPQAADMPRVTGPDAAELTPLLAAVLNGQLEILQVLLHADPQAACKRGRDGSLPLHLCASGRRLPSSAAVMELLLAAAPDTAAAFSGEGLSPLHIAGMCGNVPAVRALMHTAPQTLQLHDANRQMTPLAITLSMAARMAEDEAAGVAEGEDQAAAGNAVPANTSSLRLEAARAMLAATPPDASLPLLAQHGHLTLPLYPEVAAHWPLTATQWAQVPSPCPRLGTALPAALQRSEAEAARLVACLPAADAARLRAIALALHRAQRCLHVSLPAELARHIVSLFDA